MDVAVTYSMHATVMLAHTMLVLSSAAGVAGVFYVTTGVHGAHVLVGMLLILLYTVQVHSWSA